MLVFERTRTHGLLLQAREAMLVFRRPEETDDDDEPVGMSRSCFLFRYAADTLAFCSSRVHLVQFLVIRHLLVPLGTGVVKTFRYVPLIEWLLGNINTLGQPISVIRR